MLNRAISTASFYNSPMNDEANLIFILMLYKYYIYSEEFCKFAERICINKTKNSNGLHHYTAKRLGDFYHPNSLRASQQEANIV